MANECADTLVCMQASAVHKIRAVYCSRAIRTVMTAYRVAKKLGLPLHISSGLSRSVSGIRALCNDDPEGFQFSSMEHCVDVCKGVQVKDADLGGPEGISKTNWVQACGDVARLAGDRGIGLVIGHREMPRALAGNRDLATPYCCIYSFCVGGEGADKSDYTVEDAWSSDGKPL
jgi:hypothetical protein